MKMNVGVRQGWGMNRREQPTDPRLVSAYSLLGFSHQLADISDISLIDVAMGK
jgi:hypothetical protein